MDIQGGSIFNVYYPDTREWIYRVAQSSMCTTQIQGNGYTGWLNLQCVLPRYKRMDIQGGSIFNVYYPDTREWIYRVAQSSMCTTQIQENGYTGWFNLQCVLPRYKGMDIQGGSIFNVYYPDTREWIYRVAQSSMCTTQIQGNGYTGWFNLQCVLPRYKGMDIQGGSIFNVYYPDTREWIYRVAQSSMCTTQIQENGYTGWLNLQCVLPRYKRMDIQGGSIFNVYYPDTREWLYRVVQSSMCTTQIQGLFQNHKGELVNRKTNTYRYNHKERCDLGTYGILCTEYRLFRGVQIHIY